MPEVVMLAAPPDARPPSPVSDAPPLPVAAGGSILHVPQNGIRGRVANIRVDMEEHRELHIGEFGRGRSATTGSSPTAPALDYR